MQTTCKPRADLMQTSCRPHAPRADLMQISCRFQTSSRPRADLAQTSCSSWGPRANLIQTSCKFSCKNVHSCNLANPCILWAPTLCKPRPDLLPIRFCFGTRSKVQTSCRPRANLGRPHADLVQTLCKPHVLQTSCIRRANLMQTSCTPVADLVHLDHADTSVDLVCKPRADLVTSCRPRANLVQTLCKPHANILTSYHPVQMPLSSWTSWQICRRSCKVCTSSSNLMHLMQTSVQTSLFRADLVQTSCETSAKCKCDTF